MFCCHKWRYYNLGKNISKVRICKKCGKLQIHDAYFNMFITRTVKCRTNFMKLNINDERNF